MSRHRNRALQACVHMELYFSLEYWGKNGCYKVQITAGATAPNNDAQDVHLNSWIYWIINNSCDVKHQSLRRTVRKEVRYVLMCNSTFTQAQGTELSYLLGYSVIGAVVFVGLMLLGGRLLYLRQYNPQFYQFKGIIKAGDSFLFTLVNFSC